MLPGGGWKGEGGFATVRDPLSGDRLRAYSITVGDGERGYVIAWKSLRQLDDAAEYLALVLGGVVIGGMLAAGAGSYAVAAQVLRPVSVMTQSAHEIAASRGFSRRIGEPDRLDELGRLARTFNEMLESLEEAYRSQQRFVADAAHELRAPLTAIQGNIDLLKSVEAMPPEERAEALAYVEAEARRLSRIVSELLTLARADAGQTLDLRPVELDRIVLDALAEVRALAESHHLCLDEIEPVMVLGNADRLKQLVLNLIDNSIKYTPPGGRVSVSLEARDDLVSFSVRDDGIGIPAEDVPHVFERFYRADPARSRDPGGTGLGLSIVAWIVEQHSGEIEVRSGAGRGTDVTVRLPVNSLDP
jgi:two-component system, OmpR family, sensor kinase